MTWPRSLQLATAFVLLGIASLLTVMPARAQRLEGPTSVQATLTGSFEYQAVFTAGPGGDFFAFYEVDGSDGTDVGHWIADGFCDYWIAPGQQIPIGVSGSLLDPATEGRVTAVFSTQCGAYPWGGEFTVVTTILPSPEMIAVDIDIKPSSDVNPFNPASRGVVPVAILGSDTFDVADVDVTTLVFGPSAAAPVHNAGGHLEDVNDDGLTDLVSQYQTEEAGIAFGDTEACVTGETLDGTPFEGCDSVKVLASPGGQP